MDGRYDWAGLYHDAEDPRLFVPKRNPSFGWTVNLEKTYRRPTHGQILIAPVVGIVLGLIVSYRHH